MLAPCPLKHHDPRNNDNASTNRHPDLTFDKFGTPDDDGSVTDDRLTVIDFANNI